MRPTIGRTVHYVLTEADAAAVNKRISDARANMDGHRANATGVVVHVGNDVTAGEIVPLIISKVWGNDESSAFNGQAILDANFSLWVTSTSMMHERPLMPHEPLKPGKCFWPPRVE